MSTTTELRSSLIEEHFILTLRGLGLQPLWDHLCSNLKRNNSFYDTDYLLNAAYMAHQCCLIQRDNGLDTQRIVCASSMIGVYLGRPFIKEDPLTSKYRAIELISDLYRSGLLVNSQVCVQGIVDTLTANNTQPVTTAAGCVSDGYSLAMLIVDDLENYLDRYRRQKDPLMNNEQAILDLEELLLGSPVYTTYAVTVWKRHVERLIDLLTKTLT